MRRALPLLLLLLGAAACNNDPLVALHLSVTTQPPPVVVPQPTGLPGEGSSPTPSLTSTPDDSPTPTPTPCPSPAPTPELSCGYVVVRDLHITTDQQNGPEIFIRAWNNVSLTDPDASALNGLGVEPGTYDRVRFTIHKRVGDGSGGSGTGDPEVSHSVELCGTWTGITFHYADDVTTDVDRRDPGGVVIDSHGPARLLLVFDSSTWFDGIDLSAARISPDGVVYLDRDHNPAMARQLRENFKASVRLANEQHR